MKASYYRNFLVRLREIDNGRILKQFEIVAWMDQSQWGSS